MEIIITADAVGLIFVSSLLLLLLASIVWAAYRAGRRNRTQLLQATLMDLPLGVAMYDSGKQASYSNEAAQSLLGHIDPVQLEGPIQAAWNGLRQTSVVTGDDGIVVQVQCWPLHSERQTVLVSLRDITQQQAAASGYRKFIYTISHELLTPLTAIHGHLTHIEASDVRDETAWRGSLRVVQDEVERLTRLTSNLLLLSRLESGQPLQRRPTNLASVAEEAVLQLLERADLRHIKLNIHAAPRLPRPAVDRDAWKQVFLNLIDNSIKYGQEGGTVNISLQEQGGNSASLLVAVADNGTGIAADDLPHIFTEMYRADSQRHVSGTGLGLAIVRRIVEQHGGTITCSSPPGAGTIFSILLPVSPTPPVTPPTPIGPASAPQPVSAGLDAASVTEP